MILRPIYLINRRERPAENQNLPLKEKQKDQENPKGLPLVGNGSSETHTKEYSPTTPHFIRFHDHFSIGKCCISGWAVWLFNYQFDQKGGPAWSVVFPPSSRLILQ